MKVKKYLVVAVLVLLILPIIAGCGKNKDESANNTSDIVAPVTAESMEGSFAPDPQVGGEEQIIFKQIDIRKDGTAKLYGIKDAQEEVPLKFNENTTEIIFNIGENEYVMQVIVNQDDMKAFTVYQNGNFIQTMLLQQQK